MTLVSCPYCGLMVVEQPRPIGYPLPCFRDAFVGPDGLALGLRSGPHSCIGLDTATRIYGHARAEVQP